MSIEENVQIVKDFFAAMGSGDKQGLLALAAEDIEWIVPGKDWALAGMHRGHAGLAVVLQKASEEIEMTYPEPPVFVAQGDRVMVVGVATGKIKATNKPFKDDWVFAITIRNGKLTNIREYIDTQALAMASETDAGPKARPDRIRARAYALWKDEGMPDGEHDRHWRAAELEIGNGVDGLTVEDLPTEGATHADEIPETPPYMLGGGSTNPLTARQSRSKTKNA